MKKIICILLTILMTFSLCVTAFAKEPCNELPVILVRGMDPINVRRDVGTENETRAFDFSFGTLAPALIKSASQLLIFRDKEKALDEIIDGAYNVVKYNTMDHNGEPAYNTGMLKYPESAENYPEICDQISNEMGLLRTFVEHYDENHVYYINYDWRLDPLSVADEINETIERAVRESGHSKVNIVCASMGGIMTVAYLTKYGYSRVDRCIFMSSTFCGAQVASDVLTGKLKIDGDVLYNMLRTFIGGNRITDPLMSVVYKTGIFELITRLCDGILEMKQDEIYDKVLVPVFGYTLSLWGLVQPEDFNDAIDFVFGDTKAENAAFIRKAQALQDMMAGRTALLKKMIKSGVKVAILSNYGLPCVPLYEHSYFMGDTTLETYNTSGYATVASYGETLGDDYVAKNPSLLSPDRCIDLSTAILPEYTYMIKYAPHVAGSYGTDYADFVMWLLSTDGSAKAGANERYPQFMVSDFKKQTLAPLTAND